MKSHFYNRSNHLQAGWQNLMELICMEIKRMHSARKVGKISPGMGIPKVISLNQKRQFRCENRCRDR